MTNVKGKTRRNAGLHESTFDRLEKYGKFQDSWDEVVNKVLDELEKYKAADKRRSGA